MWIAINIEKETTKSDIVTDFERKARIVQDLYNKILSEQKMKFSGVQKISISLSDEPDINFVNGPIKGISPVATLRKTYDFNRLINQSEFERKKEILILIHNSVTELGNKYEWNIDGFDHIFDLVLSMKFNHSYYEIPYKKSRGKNFQAGVKVEMLEDGAQISIMLESQEDSKVTSYPLIKTHPNRMFIKQIVGKGRWLNNDEYEMVDKSGEIHFKVSSERSKLELYFTPKTRSEDQLIDELLIAASTSSKRQLEYLIKNKIDDLLNNN